MEQPSRTVPQGRIDTPRGGAAGTTVAARPRSSPTASRAADTPVYRAARHDLSLWSLVGVNLAALLLALWQGWTLAEMMLVYWGQSVVIGAANVVRILALREFSTDGFRINNRAVQPTRATQRRTAAFFVVHFGIFHAVYLVFLVVDRNPPVTLGLPLWLCTAAFAVNHLFSLRYNIEVDRAGHPNIGTLMFTPYLRILPMHLLIVVGLHLGTGLAGMLLFVLLKTAADAAMHLVEHARFKGGGD